VVARRAGLTSFRTRFVVGLFALADGEWFTNQIVTEAEN